MECPERTLVSGKGLRAIVVPICACDTQFLIADEINEIHAVGYVSITDGTVKWKFGEPPSPLKEEIEAELKSLFFNEQ